MTAEEIEGRLVEIEGRIDSLGESTAATDSALLALLHVVLPALVENRLIDLDSLAKQIDQLVEKKAARLHDSYGAILTDFKAILLQVREDNDAGLH